MVGRFPRILWRPSRPSVESPLHHVPFVSLAARVGFTHIAGSFGRKRMRRMEFPVVTYPLTAAAAAVVAAAWVGGGAAGVARANPNFTLSASPLWSDKAGDANFGFLGGADTARGLSFN